ncbi:MULTISPECIES: VacJ family lipoprotein [unclassified Limnobacter]|jgi:phospholipid-binding lipoprotein MlaA|uniref:MlaA family lipoprotein n=1 Tax=unclassified Limnobacter TaxID=2630203 RepID=UPI000156C91A|nr:MULTISPECIES: VacJ family lipoprotein [unclassified Limnobacter]EDM85118.1 VacJ-like lipoprotein [Limnobacter sp. MED105]
MSIRKVILLLGVLGLSTACTSMRAPSESDPLEGFNRSVDGFNQVVDKAVVKPLAQGYDKVTPPEIKTVIGNFFSNLDDISVAVNNLLQGKPKAAGSDITRFALNTTIGIVGLADVATELGFQKNDEDFGQTLGVWGMGSGPYLVLPLLGPSTLRDAPARFVDAPLDPLYHYDNVRVRNSLLVVNVVNTRARLLPATDLVERVALDQYAFVRDAYLKRRASLVRDGAPDPNEQSYEDFEEESRSDTPVSFPPFKAALVQLETSSASLNTQPDSNSSIGLPTDLQQSERAKSGLGLVN